MSPTFRALRNPNYRLYLAGSVVSNTGTWMQRVAQDWLVLSLPGHRRHRARHHHRPAVPAGAPARAVRRRDRGPVPQAAPAPAHPARHGALGARARRHRRQRARRGLDGLRAWRSSSASRRPSTPRPASRSSPRWSAPTTSPTRSASTPRRSTSPGWSGPAVGRPADRAARRRRAGLRLGDPAQRRRRTSRSSGSCGGWTSGCCTRPRRAAATPGTAARGGALRPLPAQDADDPGAGVLRRHVRHELPDHLGADGHPGVRQGRRRVRHPRLGARGRLAVPAR